jgi:hypothetical protein
MRVPEAIIFDLDDTIVDDTGGVDECWEAALSEAVMGRNGVTTAELWSAIEAERLVLV